MDNKKSSQLESLFLQLATDTKLFISEVLVKFNLKIKQLNKLTEQLIFMGLPIKIGRNYLHLRKNIEPINIDSIKKQLKKNQINKEVYYHFNTGSTNINCAKKANQSIHIADYQSTAYGRQARKWATPLGQSVTLSISHHFTFGLNQLSGLSIAIGVAIINSINTYQPCKAQLKWPNDVLTNDAKLAGILIEASGNKDTAQVIIGLGLNWNIGDEIFNNIDQACTNVQKLPCGRSDFIATLIIQIELILKEFEKSRLENILPIWNQYDSFKNRNIHLIKDNSSLQGKYLGIDKDGLLKIKINNKIKHIVSGEFSLKKIS